MPDAIYKITFTMSDGSTKDIEFTAPQGPQGPKGDSGSNNVYACSNFSELTSYLADWVHKHENYGSAVAIRIVFSAPQSFRFNYEYSGTLKNDECENTIVLTFNTYNDIMTGSWIFAYNAYDSTGNLIKGGPFDTYKSLVDLNGRTIYAFPTIYGVGSNDI